MSRALITLIGAEQRERAIRAIKIAPDGTRIEYKSARRSTSQNSRLWAMLTDVAQQKKHAGSRYTTDQWKVLFMHACGREVQYIPSLDGSDVVPWGQSSSDLSKSEMSDLIEFILAWGTENGVTFHDRESA